MSNGPALRHRPICHEPEKTMPQIHLRAKDGDYAPLVLLPGDPNRATGIADS